MSEPLNPDTNQGPDQGTTPQDPERQKAIAEQASSLRRFTWLLVGSGIVLVAGSVWWRGLDFGVPVLLGFGVILLNFFWTKKAVKAVFYGGQPKSLLTLSFLAKFGVTAAVLFYAILRLNMDGVGVLIGLSSMILASVLYTLSAGINRR